MGLLAGREAERLSDAGSLVLTQCPRECARFVPPCSAPQTMPYRLDESTGIIDYDMLEKTAALFRCV